MPTSPKTRAVTRAPLARYSNYFEVGQNTYEFLVDFGQYQPDTAGVVLHTRIALGPPFAKLLQRMLRDALDDYEARNGAIADLDDAPDPFEVLLRSLPDFEHRATSARGGAPGRPSPPFPKRPTQKR